MTKIRIKNVNLHYGEFHALKNVSLEIPEKAIMAFIGPSGCGKSTLLKSINRMNDLVEGCRVDGLIALDGEDVYAPTTDVNLLRKRVGMVFQKPNPFPMSVYDNIAFGPRTHGIRGKKELDRLVERSLRQAAIWDELKDRLGKSALGLVLRCKSDLEIVTLQLLCDAGMKSVGIDRLNEIVGFFVSEFVPDRYVDFFCHDELSLSQ